MELEPITDRQVDAAPLSPARSMPPDRIRPGEGTRPGEEPAIVDPAENNVVFTSLVTSDKDIVGLVAYSIYKQNKYDWLNAFGRQMGRMPDDAEAQSYLLGESTSRRLATYRHLAEATLGGRGVDVPAGGRPSIGRGLGLGGGDGSARTSPLGGSRAVLIGIAVLVLVLVGLFWAFHGGPAPAPPRP